MGGGGILRMPLQALQSPSPPQSSSWAFESDWRERLAGAAGRSGWPGRLAEVASALAE